LKLGSYYNRLINGRKPAVKFTVGLIRIYLRRTQPMVAVPTTMTILAGRHERAGNGMLVEVESPRPCSRPRRPTVFPAPIWNIGRAVMFMIKQNVTRLGILQAERLLASGTAIQERMEGSHAE
jgi:hypothetical protein